MPAMSRRSFAQTPDGKVVCFSAARRKDNLVLFSADQSGHFTPRAIDRGACLLPKAVDTRRISERLDYRARHRCGDSRVHGRRGAVVQVNSTSCHEIPVSAANLARGMRHLRGQI
jgi:hypothetical protein